jgi:hypothetical protein
MNLLVQVLQIHVPASLKKKKLRDLFESTAKAFEVDMPSLDHLTFKACLQKYASFTSEEIEKRLLKGEDLREVRGELYLHAYRLGQEIRERLHISNEKEVMSAGKALYRSIGIDFEGSSIGTVVIRSCFFSRFYSEQVCRIMSSLDEGIAAGLSGGGKLSFSQRITEGKPCCEAFLAFGEEVE